eukprot:2122509-Pleurochrysis_carterae.AAC.2
MDEGVSELLCATFAMLEADALHSRLQSLDDALPSVSAADVAVVFLTLAEDGAPPAELVARVQEVSARA